MQGQGGQPFAFRLNGQYRTAVETVAAQQNAAAPVHLRIVGYVSQTGAFILQKKLGCGKRFQRQVGGLTLGTEGFLAPDEG